jgi:hypothetical protein
LSTKLLEFEQEKLELDRKRLIYIEKCQFLDQIEDELEFVRGKQALIDMGLHVVRGGGTETTTSEERKGQGQGTISLPPRPFEIDDENSTSLPTTTSTLLRGGSILGGLNRHARKDSDQGSEDGTLPPIDNGDYPKGEGEDSLIDRSGSTGGSVVAALGRALTVRRRNNTNTDTPITDKSKVNNTTEHEDDEEGEGWMEDKKVKAALDFSKTK